MKSLLALALLLFQSGQHRAPIIALVESLGVPRYKKHETNQTMITPVAETIKEKSRWNPDSSSLPMIYR